MLVRSIPLRLKLIAALLLPLAVVASYLGIRVSSALDERAVAERQTDEIARFEAVANFAQQVTAESVAMNGAQVLELSDQRVTVDNAFADVMEPGLGVSPENVERLNAAMTEIQEQRSVVGDSVADMLVGLGGEVAQNAATGPYIVAYTRFGQFSGEISSGYIVNPNNISNSRTVDLLSSYSAVLRLRNNLATTFSNMSGTAPLPGAAIGEPVVTFLATQNGRNQEAQSVVFESALPEVQAEVQAVLDSPAYIAYDEQVQGLFSLPIGGEPSDSFDMAAAATSAAEVNASLQTIFGGVAESVRLEANATLDAANDQLLRSALVGGGLLLLVSAIVATLYRAIRRPLQDVTERSRHIADVELPEVVRAMRSGEVEDIPTIEPLQAQSRDEIGELVEAFNGMHRTAVDLAAEQAGSRRVVATMFVNLGRRNQRLLNRLLKQLTALEQNERDPDTLEALYGIDHLATRMRRNAESLLVLAGAQQTRKSKREVSVYDIMRAALGEVEGYQRVSLDGVDDQVIGGAYVADFTHLIAELLENALAFSPPDTTVEVVARNTARGYVVAIADQGMGMTVEDMAIANERIKLAASQDETPSDFLGHYVVGRLAARHGLSVTLREGHIGGVTARIVLPEEAFHVEPIGTDELATSEGAMPAIATGDVQTSPAASGVPVAASLDSAMAAHVPESPAALGTAPVAFVESDVIANQAAPASPAPAPAAANPPVEESHNADLPAASGSPFDLVRTPGANLPAVGLPTASADAARADADTAARDHDADFVRSNLAGFQSGITRANREG